MKQTVFTKNNSPLNLWDILIVLLNVAAGRGNYLLFGLTGLTKGTWIAGIVIILDFIYLISRRVRFDRKIKYSPFVIVFIMLAYNYLNVLARGGGDFVTVTENIALWILFFIILYSLYYKLQYKSSVDMRDGVLSLSKGYIWLSLISIVGVFVTFIALRAGIVSGGKPLNLDYMAANMEGGAIYEWTLLSINSVPLSLINVGRIPLFQDYGILTGLFHEPNIITHNITPCIILLMGLANKSIWRYASILAGILIMLFSASVTNILVVAVCLLVYVFIKFRSNVFVSILTAAIAVGAVLLFIRYSDDTFLNFFMGRMDSDNASNAYTSSVIEHTFVPHSLLGNNFLSTAYVSEEGVLDKSMDIGLIIWALNITFIVMYLRNVFKLITRNNSIAVAVGFASLYYLLHSAKGGMTIFLQFLPALLIFLQLYVLNYGAVSNNKRMS